MSTVLRSSATADELNQWFAGIDAMRESDNPGGEAAYVKSFPGRTTTMTVTVAEGRALVQPSYSDDDAPGPVYQYPGADPERTARELGEQLIANGYTRAEGS